MRLFHLFYTLVILTACANETLDTYTGSASDAEVSAMLAFLNHESTTLQVLDEEVPLNRRAAEGLIDARRSGPFRSLAAVDDVPHVGDATIRALIAYATDNGWLVEVCYVDPVGPGTFDEVTFDAVLARRTLMVANRLSTQTLDDAVGLSAAVVTRIAAGRPFATIESLASVSGIGPKTMADLAAYASAHVQTELAVISDLDSTIIPHYDREQTSIDDQVGIPGMKTLLEDIEGYRLGDIYYVTARDPVSAAEAAAWLYANDYPVGTVEGGLDAYDWWPSKNEKVADMTAILTANPLTEFILFGDTRSTDPEVCQEMIARYPATIRGCFIRHARNISDNRIAGLTLHHSTAGLALALYGRGLVSAAAAADAAAEERAQSIGGPSEAEFAASLAEQGDCRPAFVPAGCLALEEDYNACAASTPGFACFAATGVPLAAVHICCAVNQGLAYCQHNVACPVEADYSACYTNQFVGDSTDYGHYTESSAPGPQAHCWSFANARIAACPGCVLDCGEPTSARRYPGLCSDGLPVNPVRISTSSGTRDYGAVDFLRDSCD